MAALGVALLLVGGARAAVKDAGPGGFTIEHRMEISASRERVWASLLRPELWWSAEHTYSKDAKRLRLDPRRGGCWCEEIPGGGVEHMRIVYLHKARLLRLSGGLGPLQSTADGTMTYALESQKAGTGLTLIYRVWGYEPDGLAKLAPAVDGVLGEQMTRLKSLIETGDARSEPTKPKANR